MSNEQHNTPAVAHNKALSGDNETVVALNTSEGARRYVADFFARVLRRHDFACYITTTLAADFACALAQHLAATCKQPLQVGEVQGDAVRALPTEWRERAEELNLGDAVGVTHHWKLKDCADELEAALALAVRHPVSSATAEQSSVVAARQPGAQEPVGCVECPVTGLPFYDNMEHPKRGVIAMYGGPFDVFSIPELQENDGELRRERYDLDADGWVEGGEPLGYFYSDQQPDSAPPAQGIDWAPVRSALQAAEGLCACCAAVDGYSRNELHAFGLNMRQQFVDALRLLDQGDAATGVSP